MATSAAAKARLRMAAIASAVTGLTGAGLVSTGIGQVAPGVDFWAKFATNPYFLSIDGAQFDDTNTTPQGMSSFTVPAVLFVGITPDTSTDMTVVEDFITTLLTAFKTAANWTTAGATAVSVPPQKTLCTGGSDTLSKSNLYWQLKYTLMLKFLASDN